jgi:hypothetical protein
MKVNEGLNDGLNEKLVMASSIAPAVLDTNINPM